ncbi:MAG: transketolase [Patescibacteria group bacterium]
MVKNSNDLPKIATQVREDIIKMLLEAGSGHTAGSLSMTDILVALYFGIMHHDPKNPNWKDRDRLVVSNGHTCPALYAVLARSGYFPVQKLKTYAKLGSSLQGHPEREKLPGLETTSGPLGCGLAQASGMALASRMDNSRFRVFCTVSDAEHDEGNHWEAVLFAAKYKLSNLTLIIDRNNIQIEGHTEDTMPLEPLKEKYLAFNWNVLDIDGHNIAAVIEAVNEARKVDDRPTVIIARTIAGKGVSFMEGKSEWHAKVLNKEEAKLALEEL